MVALFCQEKLVFLFAMLSFLSGLIAENPKQTILFFWSQLSILEIETTFSIKNFDF
jgi:hypothetical protein